MKKSLIGFVILAVMSVVCFAEVDSKLMEQRKAEVKAFVDEAQAYIKKVGKDEALKEFQKADGKFVRGELYLFVNTMKGITLVQPMKPNLVGKDLSTMKDPNGKMFFADFAKAAASKEGKGWVEYVWQHPKTKDFQPKISYIVAIDKDTYMGAGVYVNKID
ncbi:MAG: cache domain-containing protein [Candidatus Margulisbacteria bacterium]|nr:cache domain-containing protein [Candidatus Margulisiibacteriota bacterium]